MSVRYYTKKPLTIPTVLWDGTNRDEIRVFANGGNEENYAFREYGGGIQIWNSQEGCWLNVRASTAWPRARSASCTRSATPCSPGRSSPRTCPHDH